MASLKMTATNDRGKSLCPDAKIPDKQWRFTQP
jgi:hypothetical protein